MKDIYELLNDVEIDDEEMKKVEIEIEQYNRQEEGGEGLKKDLEKAAIKRALKKRINKKNRWYGKGMVAAITTGVIIGGTLCVGVVNPTYAKGLPIVGDIFRFLDNGRTGIYDLYKENAQEINVTKESNGVSITVQDALFDGKTVYLTYVVNTDKDLGDKPKIGVGPTFSIKGYEGGMTGSSQSKKIDEHTYVAQESYTIDEFKESIKCKLKIKEILIFDANNQDSIKGNWQFEFELGATEGIREDVNKSTTEDGFSVTIDYVMNTPMSYIINYTQEVPKAYRTEWDDVSTMLEVKDDLGNSYDGDMNGGRGRIDTGIMSFTMTFGKIDERASKLIITPRILCSTYKGGVAIDAKGNETQLQLKSDKEDRMLVLPEIVIPINPVS